MGQLEGRLGGCNFRRRPMRGARCEVRRDSDTRVTTRAIDVAGVGPWDRDGWIHVQVISFERWHLPLRLLLRAYTCIGT
jgi:hypothetical protein